jgi:hypothetical protein
MSDLALITSIKADFAKDLDTFGTMEPFIAFVDGS